MGASLAGPLGCGLRRASAPLVGPRLSDPSLRPHSTKIPQRIMSNPATDPRTPATNLSTEAAAPITHFVSAAPKADYSVEELQKGRPGVSRSR